MKLRAAVVLLLLAVGIGGCFALEDKRATERCKNAQSKDDCKRCCPKRYMWTYSTSEGGKCSCR